jgi:WD40 repeat protein
MFKKMFKQELEIPLLKKWRHEHINNVVILAFSPKGDLLASGSNEGLIKVWKIENFELISILNTARSNVVIFDSLPEHSPECIKSLTYSIDQRLLASILKSGTVEIWNILEKKLVSTLTQPSYYDDSVTRDRVGYSIKTLNNDGTIIWNSERSEIIDKLRYLEDRNPSCYSPDGNTLAIGSGGYNLIVEFYNKTTGEKLFHSLSEKREHDSLIKAIKYAPNGDVIAVSLWGGKVQIFSIKEGKLLTTLRVTNKPLELTPWAIRSSRFGSSACALAFSPNGKFLASSLNNHDYDDTIKLWDVSSLMSLQEAGIAAPFLLQRAQTPPFVPQASQARIASPPLLLPRIPVTAATVSLPPLPPPRMVARIPTPPPLSQGIISNMMQANAGQLTVGDFEAQINTLQKLLEEQSQQLNHLQQNRTIMMTRQLTEQDRVIAESLSEASSLENRIRQLEQQMRQQSGRNAATESDLAKLREQHAILWQEYQDAQAVKAQQQHIAQSPCILMCYLKLQIKLNQWFVGNQAALSGAVQTNRSQSAAEQVVSADAAVGLLTKGIEPCLNLLGELLPSFPFPGAGFFINKLQGYVSGYVDKKVEKKMTHISELGVSVTRMERLTEQLARRMVVHYKLGLEQLTEASAGDVGEWCVKPVIAYLYQTDDGHFFEEALLVQGMLEMIKQGGLAEPPKGMIEKLLTASKSDLIAKCKSFFGFLNKDVIVALRSGRQCSIKVFLTKGIQVAGSTTLLNSFEKKKIDQLDQQQHGLAGQVELLQKQGDVAGGARVKALEEQLKKQQEKHEAELRQIREQQEAFQRQILAQMAGSSLASVRSPSPPHLASSASASSVFVERPRPMIPPKPTLSAGSLIPPIPAPRQRSAVSPIPEMPTPPKPVSRPRRPPVAASRPVPPPKPAFKKPDSEA